MSRIHLLPERVVSQIAAGEVVERPASVVKELVENALDAGATSIEVDLEGGGKSRVRVADDGSGMDRDDALLAFDRHATSKIEGIDDLERVATLGFRGEALATIAAVARVELVTAARPGEGTRVRIEGGRVAAVEAVPRARGTTIDVASLFFNVPARRKFLKTRETELRRAVEVVEGYALARSDVAFRVRHEGRELLAARARGETVASLGERLREIFGDGASQAMVSFDRAIGEDSRAWGLVGEPSTAGRGRRSFVFVNRRLVRDRAVMATFYRAVRDDWKSDAFPSLILFLDVPPQEVDVNVHPQKAEVRFRDSRIVDRIYEAFREALGKARGEENAPLRAPSALPGAPLAWRGHETEESEEKRLPGKGSDQDQTGYGEARSMAGAMDEVRESAPTSLSDSATAAFVSSLPESLSESAAGEERNARARAVAQSGLSPGRLADLVLRPLDRAPVPLSGRSGAVRPFRLLGQYKGALVLLEGPDGLYLLDQHVAHERILYERLRRDLESAAPSSQRFVVPAWLELARSEAMKLEELAPELEAAGFSLSAHSGGALALSAAPSSLGVEEAKALLLAIATDREASAENLRRRLLDDWAASSACKAAVKMHHPMAPEKLEALVEELFRAENPYACPHGRPVVLVLHDADLERRFGRR